MCSIAGFISKQPLSNYYAQRLSSALLYHGADRGKQSSGIFIKGTEMVMAKKATSPFEFIKSDEFYNLWHNEDRKATIVLCHTRQPTSGGTGDAQAHPFWVGNTVAVHNGGIYNVKELRQKYQLTKDSGVDSEIICSAMDKLGPKGLADVISDMSGNASVAILHNDELYVGCDGNPFEYFTFELGDENSVTVFASTSAMIQQALHHVWLFEDCRMKTESLPKMQLFKLQAGGLLTGVSKFSTKTYSAGRWHGNNGNYGYGHSDEYEANWRERSGAGSPATTTAIVPITLPAASPPSAAKPIDKNDLKSISHPDGTPGLGYFRICTISGRAGWMYSRRMAELQLKKFPNLSREGGGGKGKKDRNRNGTSASHS